MEGTICDWGSGLPNHLLDCVLERVDSCQDVLQFGSVCQNWRSTAKARAKKRVLTTPPMLLVGDEKDSHALWAFDAAGRFLRSKLSVPYEKRFCGSSLGWLAAVNEDYSVTLCKPFSSSSPAILLPPVFPPSPEILDWPESALRSFYPYHVRKLLLTADPVEDRDECVVVAILRGTSDLAVFRPGRDSAWSITKCPGARGAQELMLLRGTSRVYAVGCLGDVRYIDLDHIDRDSVLVHPPCPEDYKDSNNYLVQSCSGETIYLVQRFFNKLPNPEETRVTTKVEVFAIDLSTGKYEIVSSIGDNAFFLGDNSSICVQVAPSSACLPDCIYFTHDRDLNNSSNWRVRDICVYDLQTQGFKARYSIKDSIFRAMGNRPPIFVIPTLVF